jgi:ABC-type iron transport system FetAB ATPase subunit
MDLALSAGEITLLAGPSGGGKSRLLRALADLDRPAAGDLRLGDTPSPAMAAPDYRSRVAYLPATPQLGPATVRGLVARVAGFGHRRELNDPRAGLERLGLPESVLDRAAEDLSTGETVRVALALLLAGDTRVLLLDEPTGALDPPSARAVEAWVRERANGGAAVLWVTHDPDQAARVGDALLTLADGTLAGPDRDRGRFADAVRRLDPEAAAGNGP